MDVEIRVDQGRCIGSGQCVNLAPGVFDQDAQAKAFVHDQHGEPEERIIHAITACPMAAIRLSVGETSIGPDELRDWDRGARLETPLADIMMELAEQHHRLRQAFARAHSTNAGGVGSEEVLDELDGLLRDHLVDESAAYADLVALVDPKMVDVFEDSHRDIADALDDRATRTSAPPASWLTELYEATEQHIRLEETMLFPVALNALWRNELDRRELSKSE